MTDASPLRNDLRDKGWDFVEAEDGRITWRMCNIIMASSMYRDYRVEWARGGQEELEDERTIGTGEGFLELLEPGFIVVLWARAEVSVLSPCVIVASLLNILANLNDSDIIGEIESRLRLSRSNMSYELRWTCLQIRSR